MSRKRRPKNPQVSRLRCGLSVVALALPSLLRAQQAAASIPPAGTLESVSITGNWLGTGLENSVQSFPGARTVMKKVEIEASGAGAVGEAMRRIPGVQATENSGTAGSAISLNIGVRGLTGRYTPRSTVLVDGVPLAVAPYGQPQLSFAPISLNNIEAIDVVRSGGAVRYGPQNVGGIINFRTREVPAAPGLTSDVSVRQTANGVGSGRNTQYSAFLGTRLDGGLGLALLYSATTGSGWRAGSSDRVDDLAVKARYEIGSRAELFGKVTHYRIASRTPGGLTVSQFVADPFQNTRPTDNWAGERNSVELGYVNSISAIREFELKTYYTDSTRQSTLINDERTQLAFQPRNYRVLGVEPRYTQRFTHGSIQHDVTVGYRYIRERGEDSAYAQSLTSDVIGLVTRFDNATDAHAVYVDDRIAIGPWRVTPGVRFERISSKRGDWISGNSFESRNNKGLPSLSIAHLLAPTLTLFTNYATSFGPVQNAQLNSQSAANPLTPELAKTAEIGARWTDTQVRAELTVFRIRFANQIQQVAGVQPTLFRNVGATKHAGVETAIDYRFERGGTMAGLNLFGKYSYTSARQDSGPTAGRDLPFYARNVDTVGARYAHRAWSLNISSTHQSGQFSDNANTDAETADAGVGRVPGFRLWSAQIAWKMAGATSVELLLGVNNIADKRYYTRSIDGNQGRMVGPPRTTYVQGRLAF